MLGPRDLDRLRTDIVEWDVRNWGHALRYWEQELPGPLDGRRALDVGARHGGLSLYLALRGCDVVCSDREAPTREARQKMARHDVAHRVCYERLDVHAIPHRDHTFDVVAFKSVLGHVTVHQGGDGQRRAMAEIHRVLKPGGLLLFAENLAGSWFHRLSRRHGVAWGSTWRYVPLERVRELTSMFRVVRFATYGFLGCFGRSERQRGWLAVADRLLDPIVTERAKYIVFGYARK